MDEDGRLSITGRKKDVIVLAAGENIDPQEIEAAYLQSLFVKEICVLGLAARGRARRPKASMPLWCPNLDLLRERRIVNAGDLLRFEMEGLSIHLPPHKRVSGYEIWFEPLPRTTTGKVKRHEMARRVRERRRAGAGFDRDDAAFDGDDDCTRAAAVAVIARRAVGKRIAPESNLELDLGLDSMERVELLSEIEQQLGVSNSGGAGARDIHGAPADRRRPRWRSGCFSGLGGLVGRHVPRSAAARRPAAQRPAQPRPIAARVFFLAPRACYGYSFCRACAPPASTICLRRGRSSSARTIRDISIPSSSVACCRIELFRAAVLRRRG